MKKKFIFIALVLIAISISKLFAQVEITKSNTSYGYDDNRIDLSFYVIKNTSDTAVFLWFDKEKNNNIPLILRVHSYIFRPKRDFNFYNLAHELRVGTARMVDGIMPVVGYGFIKQLNPNQSFTVIIKEKSIDSFSEDFIEIVPYSVFKEVHRTLPMDWFDAFEYKEDFIVF